MRLAPTASQLSAPNVPALAPPSSLDAPFELAKGSVARADRTSEPNPQPKGHAPHDHLPTQEEREMPLPLPRLKIEQQ
jgi:hypothetical protein